MYNVGLIRVLTVDDEEALNLHGAIIQEYLPQLRVISRCIPDQPCGIYDACTEREAIPKILQAGKDLRDEGVMALIVSCAADPGVQALRRQVSIPVIGAGSAGASVALALGGPVGVLGITGEAPEAMARVLGQNLAGVARPEKVKTTLDLQAGGALEEVERAARGLVEGGARSIALACTGMTTCGAASHLAKRIDAPVVDPVLAAALAAYSAVVTRGLGGKA
ncbi:MAG: aspartate/glutamate racemase family protein [Bacillota bacterium]